MMALTGWQWVRLGDHVTKVGSGLTPRGGEAVYQPSGIPLIRSQNVHLNRFETEGLVFISPEQDEEMKKTRVQPGDVLLNITGASIGRVCVVPTVICPANVNQHVCIIRSDGTIDPAFLTLFISSPDFQRFIQDSQSGATRQALTKQAIEDFQVPLPPLPEQKRIAAILGRADRLRHLRRTARELSDTYLQSVFLEMFGDPATNPREWERATIGDVVVSSQYGTSNRSNSEQRGYPILGMGNIAYSGRIDLISLSYVELSKDEFGLFGISRGKATYGGPPTRQIGDNPRGRGKDVGIES
jgi:type I restriction enzyme S subunit